MVVEDGPPGRAWASGCTQPWQFWGLILAPARGTASPLRTQRGRDPTQDTEALTVEIWEVSSHALNAAIWGISSDSAHSWNAMPAGR